MSYKSLLIRSGKTLGIIHPISKISGYRNIIMSTNSVIRSHVNIVLDNSKLVMKDNSYINDDTFVSLKNCILKLGNNSFLNPNCTVIGYGDIAIGNDVMIAHGCSLISGNHGYADRAMPIRLQKNDAKNIQIDDGVWVGCNEIILGGVKIEKGSIIGAGSVVTKSIGSYEIWAGNPAKFIRKRD